MKKRLRITQTVFLKTDPEMLPRIITGYEQTAGAGRTWKLAQGTNISWHNACEIESDETKLFFKKPPIPGMNGRG